MLSMPDFEGNRRTTLPVKKSQKYPGGEKAPTIRALDTNLSAATRM